MNTSSLSSKKGVGGTPSSATTAATAPPIILTHDQIDLRSNAGAEQPIFGSRLRCKRLNKRLNASS